MSLSNPAGRLRYWIEKFDQHDNNDEAVMNATCRILGLDSGTVDGRFAAVRLGSALADQCAMVRREASLLPDALAPELLLADFHQVEGWTDLFAQSRQVPVKQMKTAIDPAGRRGLEVLDRFLDTHLAHTWIEEDQWDTLIAQVRHLIDDVAGANDLDSETKEFILVRLSDVEKALRDVLITGTAAVENATDALIGAMRRRPDVWDRIAATKYAKRLGMVAGALCLALSSAGGIPALMPGDDPQPEQTVKVEINNGDGVPAGRDGDVVEGEIVEHGLDAVPDRQE